ncbi:uncharacterized protein F21D5.5 [Drosophila yakuba]|uniref:PNK FHA domain-containing protein n=1 Tax=Drosophila yakuba TaxID=7245 RepID=B4PT50_DROYA|nr:uncharacterized protein F21D5.5 [Drosophila yakuba]EDW96511.1 uncharacterized protein Dyak_GE24852 [Drosophila yakuba]
MSVAKYLNRSVGKAGKDVATRICTLKPTEPEHHTIHLTAGENFVGRSRETGIRDSKCSKRQIQLQVDLKKAVVSLKVLGVNPCGVNGLMVMQNSECELKHGDLVEIVYGRHPFEVVFNPPPTDDKQKAEPSRTTLSAPAESERWDSVGNGKLVIFTSAGVKASEKIAGYDMDGTIIKTKSGLVFPKNTDDWQIIFPEVPEKLKNLHKEGFKICFFTNQGGIARGKINLDDFKVKIKQIVAKLEVPIQVFIAIGDGFYRKPLTGMWQHLKSEMNDGVEIQEDRCFFVGDAAGRPETGKGATKQRKDHSLADRLFAANVGLSFYTPEVHFLGKRVEQWNKPDFDPTIIQDQVTLFEPDDLTFDDHPCEMVIMVGLPGSGKSHFCVGFFQSRGYKIANADTLGSTQNCLTACKRFLDSGQSCVVDNTNVDAASRKKFLQLASDKKIPCRCLVMNVPVAQVKHNIAFRELSDTAHSKIKDMVFNMMKKKYQEPALDEGFISIHKVNFKPSFADEKQEKLYKMYLVEK